jgi:hypothetical protein
MGDGYRSTNPLLKSLSQDKRREAAKNRGGKSRILRPRSIFPYEVSTAPAAEIRCGFTFAKLAGKGKDGRSA